MIDLRPLEPRDAGALLAFERENSVFFENWVPPRPEAFFDPDGFAARLDELINDPDFHPFLIWDGTVADLGYRVGERAQGRGIATKAVELALDWTSGRFTRVEAEVEPRNPGSARVLAKCGFVPTDEKRSFVAPDGREVTLYRWGREV